MFTVESIFIFIFFSLVVLGAISFMLFVRRLLLHSYQQKQTYRIMDDKLNRILSILEKN
ncbi:DUF4083 family protein [Bacillus sp. 1P06AnD]|uniref:DUF4083 family protein n=1 Tax=Bacillus sp. 1P06AnD TaxID=3132208 RepID=UPI0039A078BF